MSLTATPVSATLLVGTVGAPVMYLGSREIAVGKLTSAAASRSLRESAASNQVHWTGRKTSFWEVADPTSAPTS